MSDLLGMRHPFLGLYKVGFTQEGKLVSLELDMFANAGYSMDLSLGMISRLSKYNGIAVVERSLTHSDNAYKIPNVKLRGRLCRTNLPTNTAFRGFGGPQGMLVAETWITHVAEYLGKPVEEIRVILFELINDQALNFYQNGEITHIKMPVDDVFLHRLWDELLVSSDFK